MSKRKPRNFWNNIDNLTKEAKKYKSRYTFSKNNVSAYNSARRLGVLEDICSHMEVRKVTRYWTKERCRKEALQYSSRVEFREKGKGAYWRGLRDGFLDEICRHMPTPKEAVRGAKIWTKDRLIVEALKYKERKEFRVKASGAYKRAKKTGVLDEICSHMKKRTTIYNKKRIIYVYEFSNKSAYIGLTCDLNRRKQEHKRTSKSSVYRFLEKNPCVSYSVKELGIFSEDVASNKECYFIAKYRKEGWQIINVAEGGSLGASYIAKDIWTIEKCQEVALNYNSRIEFKQEATNVYKTASKKGFLQDICSHMPFRKKFFNMSKEEIKTEALKYKSRTNFCKGSRGAYNKARVNNWLDEFFPK